jgi:hypothetical protein
MNRRETGQLLSFEKEVKWDKGDEMRLRSSVMDIIL